jgi:MATE family multidrug resistance protein
VLRCFMDALGKTFVTMVITLISLPINVALNYILIFGKFGFPRLGGIGAGYASTITYWLILMITVWVVYRVSPFSAYRIFHRLYKVSLAIWKEQLKVGVPIGFAIFFETSIFAAVTLLMSEFNTATIAAHQVALNFASLLYMVPMSISIGLTIAVGFEVGAKRYKDASHYSYLGIGLAVGASLICAVGLALFNKEVAAFYTNDPLVLELASRFLIYSIFFMLSDAIAAPIQGALRGYKDVNAAFWAALLSYWVFGLPIGVILAKFTPFGPFGYWIGFISGLTFGALFLSVRLVRIQRQTILMGSKI